MNFDKYYWNALDKLQICLKEKIDLMIDDNYIICKNLSDNLVNTLYLRDVKKQKLEENKYLKEVNKGIINLIEKTLNEKMNKNSNYIRYTFFELRVKYNLSDQETDRFLYLIRTKLQNENYKVYFTGTRFEYKDATMKVQDNELMIAIKE